MQHALKPIVALGIVPVNQIREYEDLRKWNIAEAQAQIVQLSWFYVLDSMMVIVVQAFFGLRAWSVRIVLSPDVVRPLGTNPYLEYLAYEEKLVCWSRHLELHAHSLRRWRCHQSNLHQPRIDIVRKRRQDSCVSLELVAQRSCLIDLLLYIATSVSFAQWRQI